MYYLLCFLWVVGGGPKHLVSGHFYYSQQSHEGPRPQLCVAGECEDIKINDQNEFEIKLKEGTYELRYINQWHQPVSEELQVHADQSLVVDCTPFLSREHYPVWEAFREQGTLRIAERSEMKGRTWERLITLRSMKGGVEAELYDPAGKINTRKMLSPLESSQLEDFLRKVDLYHKSNGCETSVLYLMQAGEQTFIIEDGSCELGLLDTILYDLYVKNYVSQEFP